VETLLDVSPRKDISCQLHNHRWSKLLMQPVLQLDSHDNVLIALEN